MMIHHPHRMVEGRNLGTSRNPGVFLCAGAEARPKDSDWKKFANAET